MIGTRPARPEDATALAALHVEVWRATYANLATPEALEQLDETRRLPYWQATLASTDMMTGAFVAVSPDGLLGVASFGPSTQPEMAGAAEIKHLYVRQAARGTGVGRRLLEECLEHLEELGAERAALAVVAENENARRFYRAMGGTEGANFTDPGPLWRSSNIVVSWDLN